MKEQREKSFLEQLNELATKQKFPKLALLTPREGDKIAYAYAYLKTEAQARQMGIWLAGMGVINRQYYLQNKDNYILKVDFIETYPHSYLQDFILMGEFQKASRLLQEGAASATPDFARVYFKLLDVVISLAKTEFEYEKIHKLDSVQTTLFYTGKKYALSKLADVIIDSRNPCGGLGDAIARWCKNTQVLDTACNDLENEIVQEAKKLNKNQKKARQHVLDHKKPAIDKWIEISISSLTMGVALANNDNEIYKNWLFINKQLKDLSSCDGEIKDKFLSRFEELKKSIMEHGDFLREKMTGYQLYPNGADQYVANFLRYEFGMLDDEPGTQLIKESREICYDNIRKYSDLLKSVDKRTSELKQQVKDVTLEFFHAKNSFQNVSMPRP